jgi:hypothetical protein
VPKSAVFEPVAAAEVFDNRTIEPGDLPTPPILKGLNSSRQNVSDFRTLHTTFFALNRWPFLAGTS